MHIFDRPTALTGADGMRAWIEMFVKAPFHGMDPGLRLEIERAAVEALEPTHLRGGVWYADYTRLRCRCERPRWGAPPPMAGDLSAPARYRGCWG